MFHLPQCLTLKATFSTVLRARSPKAPAKACGVCRRTWYVNAHRLDYERSRDPEAATRFTGHSDSGDAADFSLGMTVHTWHYRRTQSSISTSSWAQELPQHAVSFAPSSTWGASRAKVCAGPLETCEFLPGFYMDQDSETQGLCTNS